MPRRHFPKTALACAVAASLLSSAHAVTLDEDGLGQALIFPYYTVRAAEGGNALNTYVSVVNSTGDAKAVRVRIREARAGREVASFNLYLSPNDVWTGALVPTPEGGRLITADNSCTDPPFGAQPGLHLQANGYTGANADGLGDTLDRTREGFIEMIEMATLTGESRAAVIHNAAGMVPGCAAMRANPSPSVAAPGGGLWGSLTLINVNNGQDFTLDAVALSNLSTRSFFRMPADPYPDFNAAEIDPVSTVVADGQVYRSAWSRPVDAVSATLMKSDLYGEYVLDTASASQTELVLLAPTRHYYFGSDQVLPPFFDDPGRFNSCGTGTRPAIDYIGVIFFNREERGATPESGSPSSRPGSYLCAAASVGSLFWYSQLPAPATPTQITGSRVGFMGGTIPITQGFQNGFLRLALGYPYNEPQASSLPQSTRTDLATGQVRTGPHTYQGLPLLAYTLRTFRNGNLACASGACQGNYGGAFPFKALTRIEAP